MDFTPYTEGVETVPNVIPDEEDRLEPTPTAKMLQLHYDLGHISFEKMRRMAEKGIIPKPMATCNTPTCSACEYARATRRPWRSKTKKNRHIRKPTKPGQVVSVDQMVSQTPGLIGQMVGFITTKRYRYATIFVDNATSLGYVYLQRTPNAAETIEAKKAFEKYAANRGVAVRHYHADNGIFKAREWVEECARANQGLTFAGVNAHHQNGKAEKRIRDLQEGARAMLLHAARRWPKAISAHLWPYAIRMANDSINRAPLLKNEEGKSPQQLFDNSDVEINPKHYKPFGCPVYVLDQRLQSGQPFDKWAPRATVGIYLGQSPIHNANVALVLNRMTGRVSPQFHVRYDESFHTTKQLKIETRWRIATGFEQENESARKREIESQRKQKAKRQKSSRQRNDVAPPGQGGTSQAGETAGGVDTSEAPSQRDSDNQKQTQLQSEVTDLHPPDTTQPGEPDVAQNRAPESVTPEHLSKPTRSGRVPRPNPRYFADIANEALAEEAKSNGDEIPGQLLTLNAMFPKDDTVGNQPEVYAYKATSDPDTMYYHGSMRQKDKVAFLQAMEKEINSQLDQGVFSLVLRTQVPAGTKVLPAVWQMRRKRDIKTQEIKKHKARCNIDGSKMIHGEHYDKTYAPVVGWGTIRLLLAMVLTNSWHTVQIDYVLAYPQAPLDKEMYMEIPRGIRFEGYDPKKYVLKLHRNIYGQKDAGRIWNKYLVKKLIEDVGFTQSKVDECMFYKGNVCYILYTDDSILAGPDKGEVMKVIEEIKEAGLNITIEGDIKDFLGVNIDRKQDGVFEFTQPHLIDKILEALKFRDNTKSKATPASSSKLLYRNQDSESHDESFHYRSVIGMMNYLEKGSRSDIAYAVHQCARFSSDPKMEHAKAVRWIGKYLKGTRDKGMRFEPDESKGLEVFVDADFAGNYDKLDTSNRDTARSRHGYIIRYNGCPVVWKSQLQTEIALSTTEAEYTGLSYALREAIPIIELLKEMDSRGYTVTTKSTRVHLKVFEDNAGAVEIAREQKYRPRTKHLNNRLHHFRSYVDDGTISVHHIDTELQPADYLTKPLNEETFVRHRKTIQGW